MATKYLRLPSSFKLSDHRLIRQSRSLTYELQTDRSPTGQVSIVENPILMNLQKRIQPQKEKLTRIISSLYYILKSGLSQKMTECPKLVTAVMVTVKLQTKVATFRLLVSNWTITFEKSKSHCLTVYLLTFEAPWVLFGETFEGLGLLTDRTRVVVCGTKVPWQTQIHGSSPGGEQQLLIGPHPILWYPQWHMVIELVENWHSGAEGLNSLNFNG